MICKSVILTITCNMGRSNLPDMYKQAWGTWAQGQVQTYQAHHNCQRYIYDPLSQNQYIDSTCTVIIKSARKSTETSICSGHRENINLLFWEIRSSCSIPNRFYGPSNNHIWRYKLCWLLLRGSHICYVTPWQQHC